MKPPKALLAEWNKKLRESGIVDVERPSRNYKNDVHNPWYFEEHWDIESFKDQERYFQLAGRHVHVHKFESIKDKSIWRLHADGYSIREIEAKLGIPHNTVSDIIVRLRKTIKIDE